jgi:hypothetical protein
MAMIKMLVLGIVLCMGLPVVAGSLFILLGGMPVTTIDAPLPFERYLAKRALKAAMRKEIGKRAPMPPDDTNLLTATKVYRSSVPCVTDSPNQPLGVIAAKRMFPPHRPCSRLTRESPMILKARFIGK